MSKRSLILVVLLAATVVAIVLFMLPCGGSKSTVSVPVAPQPTAEPNAAAQNSVTPRGQATQVLPPQASARVVAPSVADKKPSEAEVDTAPPVKLTGNEELPNIAVCAIANFPAEAKPYVKSATVTVRLVVDKFGKVRENKPLAVDFPEEVNEDQLPYMRKLFINAGSRAFGSKRCPAYMMNGQAHGYAIEVPLQYKY